MDYDLIMESTINGIPCKIGVLVNGSAPHRGNAFTCDSSDDFYGYADIEYVVLDRKGYRADWLNRMMTQKDQHRILSGIKKELQ